MLFFATIDNDLEHKLKFKTDTLKKEISLASGLSAGKHTLQLYKLSNNTSENIIYGFKVYGNSHLFPHAKPLK